MKYFPAPTKHILLPLNGMLYLKIHLSSLAPLMIPQKTRSGLALIAYPDCPSLNLSPSGRGILYKVLNIATNAIFERRCRSLRVISKAKSCVFSPLPFGERPGEGRSVARIYPVSRLILFGLLKFLYIATIQIILVISNAKSGTIFLLSPPGRGRVRGILLPK
jgi:hypothetical protein